MRKSPRPGDSLNISSEHIDGYMGFFPSGGELDASTLTIPVADFHEALERVFPEIAAKVVKNGTGVHIGPGGQERVKSLLDPVMESIGNTAASLSDLLARVELERMLLDAFLEELREGIGEPRHALKRSVAGKLKPSRQAREPSFQLPANPTPSALVSEAKS